MKKIITSLAITSVLAACATDPDEMTAASVSTVQYKKYDCEQIGKDADRVKGKVMNLYSQLKEVANGDKFQMGVGLVLFWPTLFFLEGGDSAEAAEYRTLKGEYEALEKAAIEKKCDLEFANLEAELKAQAEQEAEEKQTKSVLKRK